MKNNNGCSISLDGMVLLTIALAVLKAFGKIGCSWVWVFAPLWLPLAIVAGVIVVWFIGFVLLNSGRRW